MDGLSDRLEMSENASPGRQKLIFLNVIILPFFPFLIGLGA